MRTLSATLLTCLVLVSAASAQQREARQRGERSDENRLQGVRSEVYKTAGDVELKMYIFTPSDLQPGQQRPAIVFFFGGGWKGGSPAQFSEQCRYLAGRGMVAMAADYRVHSRHEAQVADCVRDAKDAIRWVRANAERLGVDPDRIASGGGSAGGHLGAAVGTLPGFEADGAEPSSRPNAMALFNPALDLRASGFNADFQSDRYQEVYQRMGSDPESLTPTLHISAQTPPTIIFHGRDDTTIPFAQVEAFAAAMQQAGRRCEVAGYEGEAHGFFNYGRGGNKAFKATLTELDHFLTSLGYLEGEPTVEKMFATEKKSEPRP